MIALRREPLADALNAERVLELPKFVRSRTYWHVPRSAWVRDGRLGVSCWCGVSFHSSRGQTLELCDAEPTENIYGTCIGRWEGAQAGGALIFRPRDEFGMPTWCPSTESDDACNCIACGHRIRYSWQHGPARHRPGPLFGERCRPCPDHGWSRAGSRDGRVVCRAWVGNEMDYCDFDCGPAASNG